MTIAIPDERLTWQGHISMEEKADGLRPWKIDYRQFDLHHQALQQKVGFPTGMRLSFRTNSTTIQIQIRSQDIKDIPIDLVIDDEVVDSQRFSDTGCCDFSGLPPDEKEVELWLPMWGEYTWQSIALDDEATLTKWCRTGPKLLTYGSSITVCYDAHSPTRTWPAIVARECGYDLTCLGTGGTCHLDTLIGREIRDHKSDFIILSLGINIYGSCCLSERTFRPSVIGFVELIREKQPETPILLLSPIFCEARETTENKVGMSLQTFRSELMLTQQILHDYGDHNVHYLSGLELLGPDDTHGLQADDWMHPNAEGYQLMGTRLAGIIKSRFDWAP